MKINRRQFVACSAAGIFIPSVYASGNEQPIDREITGKTICGYQGWFNAKGDGMDLSFRHYQTGKGLFHPGHCTIDLWPDVSEFGAGERYDSAFGHKDGTTAQVFSSANAKTIARHHQWMKDYGIDGLALQRFGQVLKNNKLRRMRDRVTEHTRDAAKQSGRLWMNMYDLSGMKGGQPQSRIAEDWLKLIEQDVTRDKSYIHHKGKPIVAIWGVGFNDNRDYTLEDCSELIDRISMGGRFSIMLGIPYYWREQGRDTINDPRLHDVLRKADILSPWAVGRYGEVNNALRRGETILKPDVDWCNKHGKHYLPVIFPGFSWQNLKKSKGAESKLDQIPRRGGQFLWAQAEAARKAGAESLYVAMFDEIDEATAIFKCTNDPPVGESKFIDFEGLPNDHYLWLTGQIAERLRIGQGPKIEAMPKRKS
jgi:hypothetical protein